ncbi:hypothetical protein VCB98_02960 [Gammaproteobacteria bacterium AB-CW1]|uniref:Phosphatidylserine decarboxylase n=1 Tax=Natronospira elongata TaxID=3110268 RepID=A0AAP6JDI4_9GAMM|nr:hypothetical protein [Gammaproteobacteria bacterium AB-CW1]
MARESGLLAGEGWWLVIALLAVSALAAAFSLPWLALPALVLLLVVLALFRDPPRQIPSSPLAVVSPVDGRVLSVEVDARSGGQPGTVIEIEVAAFGAWSIRAPVEGKVMGLRGLTEGPERGLWLQTDEQDDVVTELIGRSSPYWARPVAFVKTGERLGQGQRFGYRRWARLARVHCHGKISVQVRVGDRVHAGSDMLATLVHD